METEKQLKLPYPNIGGGVHLKVTEESHSVPRREAERAATPSWRPTGLWYMCTTRKRSNVKHPITEEKGGKERELFNNCWYAQIEWESIAEKKPTYKLLNFSLGISLGIKNGYLWAFQHHIKWKRGKDMLEKTSEVKKEGKGKESWC